LTDVSFEARRGETVALVGPSGGGKTTILNLIPRFYDATAGRVTIDGHDVRSVTLTSLRDRIALVTQEPFLFDDSIRANIAYARPDAAQAEIEQAAREAAAHDFILDLPRGYDTQVGEAGARLSGGQRQRIAIARAFLKDAPILLLDEATSALDTESEAQVQVALKRLMAGRATILIAHRLSTVRGADRIYVIDKGRIVETGDHASLVRKRGLYARLAKTQDLDAPSETAA
jgi:subfamily B ATP-binding cassette protein MsbA